MEEKKTTSAEYKTFNWPMLIRYEALMLPLATLLLYVEGLWYVQAYCEALQIPRELFVLTFQEVIVQAWVILTTLGLLYGTLLVMSLAFLPVLIAVGRGFLTWLEKKLRSCIKPKRSIIDNKPASEGNKNNGANLDRAFNNCVAVLIGTLMLLVAFDKAGLTSLEKAKEEAEKQLNSKTVTQVRLANDKHENLIFLTRMGDTYAFMRPDKDGFRHYMTFSSSQIMGLEWSIPIETNKKSQITTKP